MSREDELALVRDQVSMLAEQVARLLEVISIRSSSGLDTSLAEEKLALIETLMWKLHRRHIRLKVHEAQANIADLSSPAA
jgi:hypothetical protein